MKSEITWPNSESDLNNTMRGFENSRENTFPFVIGCVDGCHIKIPPPLDDSVSYYNRKGNHSMILQVIYQLFVLSHFNLFSLFSFKAVCDSKYRFRNIYFGFPGSCHDAHVWNSSPLGKALQTGKIALPENVHLLADSAYPLSTFMMVPYKDNGHLTHEQKKFNYCLSSTRVFIEQSFGILKKKFQILEYVDIRRTKEIKYVVVACLVLHNFIINREKNYYIENEYSNLGSGENDVVSNEYDFVTITNEGRLKRDYLTNLFFS